MLMTNNLHMHLLIC